MSPVAHSHPYTGVNFVVEIDGVPVAGFAECSGLTSESEVIEYRNGNDPLTPRAIPGLPKIPRIVLRRGMTSDRSLATWRAQIQNGVADRRNGSIVLFDGAHQEILRWNFSAGWPTKWDGPLLDARASEVAIEAVEIAVEGINIVG